ncbi:uncharacterized protein LOC133737141 [Rosa rugosa]|uniref:uncharacterized protein LOC133737141 n=1 Tax=Rosa rugosa TaxID=74645 RepID=UPI002B415D49|nr:uncharacterized protein LOC133737141 [Rosa rugosa]
MESLLPNHTRGGLGGVLRDEQGHFKAAFALPVCNVASAKHVELLAVKQGLQLLQSFPNQEVVIETDCLEATSDIANPGYEMLEFPGVLDDIRTALKAQIEVKIRFAPRTCNAVAHRLASLGFEDNYNTIWSHVPPDCILDLLQSDRNQM